MNSELRLPHVRISSHLGEYPDVEVDGVHLNGVTEFEFKPPHRLTLVLEVGHLEALREPLRPGPREHPSVWTPDAARLVRERLSGRTLQAFNMMIAAGSEWTDSEKIQEQTGVSRQGQDVVLRPITRAAARINKPNPVLKDGGRNGQIRYLRWRLRQDFLNACLAAMDDRCARCGAPYLPAGNCSRWEEGCRGQSWPA